MGLVTSLVGKLKGQYQKLAGRYGPGWAMAIMGSGQAVGWGTTAVGAAMGVPLVIPGLSILGSLPAIGLAELHRALSGRGKKPTAPGAGGAGTSLAGAGESPGAVSHLVAGGDVQASAPARLDPVQAVVEALHRAGGKAARRDLRPHLHQLGITGPAEQHQAMEAAVAAGAAHAGGTELRLPAVGSEAAAPAQDLAALVAEAARLHGGDVNLAPLHKVRQHLAGKGIADRAQQDQAIQAARKAGLVSAQGLEGRHGVTDEEKAAAIHEPGPPGLEGSRLGFLTHLTQGGPVDQPHDLQLHERPIDLNVLAGGGAAAASAGPAAAAAAPPAIHGDPTWAPKGSDTQPAELPSGSFVVNKDSAQANPALLDQLGAATVPNVPGQVAAFTDQAALTTPAGPGQADQAAAAAAMLTPGERVVPPAVASAHPEVAQVNAAHGPVEGDPLAPPGSLSGGLNPMPEYHEGGGPVGDVPHLDQGGDIARRFRDPTGTGWTGTPAAASPSWSTIAAPAAGGSAGPLGVMPVKIVAPLPVPVTLSQGLPTGVGPAGQKTQPTDNGLPGVLGKLQKTVAEMGTPWKDLDASMGKLIVGAAAASVALHQMLQAASPEAWRTLQGSFTILAQSLGRYLIEPALKLSYAVQYLAHWVRSLDPGVMRLAGNVAFWTTVVLAGVSAIRVFGGWLVSTIGFVAGLGRGLLSLITGTTSATAATAAASSGLSAMTVSLGAATSAATAATASMWALAASLNAVAASGGGAAAATAARGAAGLGGAAAGTAGAAGVGGAAAGMGGVGTAGAAAGAAAPTTVAYSAAAGTSLGVGGTAIAVAAPLAYLAAAYAWLGMSIDAQAKQYKENKALTEAGFGPFPAFESDPKRKDAQEEFLKKWREEQKTQGMTTAEKLARAHEFEFVTASRHEVQAQQLAVTDVHAHVQNASLDQDPMRKMIQLLERQNYTEQFEKIAQELKKLNNKPGLKP